MDGTFPRKRWPPYLKSLKSKGTCSGRISSISRSLSSKPPQKTHAIPSRDLKHACLSKCHPYHPKMNPDKNRSSTKKVSLKRRETHWEQVTSDKLGGISKPIMEGGLQVRELRFQYLTMGAKILWNIVSRNSTWRKRSLWKKYFSSARTRCLDAPPRKPKCSPIFSLYLKSLPLYTPDLSWIPGNGKQIWIWEDSILGEPSLESSIGLLNLKHFLQENGYCTLWDLSSWDLLSTP